MIAREDLALRATYGCGVHRCSRCPDCAPPARSLAPATERQASVAHGLHEGDLVCPTCAALLSADADALDEMVLDADGAPSFCEACGVDCTDCEYALTPEGAGRLLLDAESALVCWDCERRSREVAP